MTAAYEAKARITVDTSQLLRASREAARSIGTLTAATREATAALNSMERSGRTAAQAMRPFASMMQTLAADSRQADTANQQLSRGLLVRRRSEEHTSELQSRPHLVCRLLLEKKNIIHQATYKPDRNSKRQSSR